MQKRIFTLLSILVLLFGSANYCEAKIYFNGQYNFQLWLPDSFEYNGPPFVTPNPNTIMEAVDPYDNTNINMAVMYPRSTPSGGPETNGSTLVYAKNVMLNGLAKKGIRVIDSGILTIKPCHEAYYIQYRNQYNGIWFDQYLVQIWIHGRLYTITYTQKLGNTRIGDIMASMYSFQCLED